MFLFDETNPFSINYKGTGFFFFTAMALLPVMMVVSAPIIVIACPFVLLGCYIHNEINKNNNCTKV